MNDTKVDRNYSDLAYSDNDIQIYIERVLRLEAVACKDWLTNKVDRCVGGRVAKQQTCGALQLPLNNCGVMALDFDSAEGIATAIGHSPVSGLIDPVAGSRNSIAEAMTNIIWAPMKGGMSGVSLSANWMWPCNNEGEDARLYKAVKAVSDFSIDLGINVPTGKDSLSMKQIYPEGDVIAPGTVVISAAGSCNDINKVVEPIFIKGGGDIYYINMSQDAFKLGGSSFAQVCKTIGNEAPSVVDDTAFAKAFNTLQQLIKSDLILAGHDVASGGLITTLLEMCFADTEVGANIDLSDLGEEDVIKVLFAENAGVVFQARNEAVEAMLTAQGVSFSKIGSVTQSETLEIKNQGVELGLNIPSLRDTWYKTSYL